MFINIRYAAARVIDGYCHDWRRCHISIVARGGYVDGALLSGLMMICARECYADMMLLRAITMRWRARDIILRLLMPHFMLRR